MKYLVSLTLTLFILYNAYFLQPGFIANSPNRVLTSHLAPSSVGSKGIQGMYAFSQIPFNGSLFLEIKSHNPYRDKKKKNFFFKFCPGVSMLLLSILPYCSPHSVPATLVFWLLVEQAKHITTQ